MNKYHIRFIIYKISYYYVPLQKKKKKKKLEISYENEYIQLINFHTSRTFIAASSALF